MSRYHSDDEIRRYDLMKLGVLLLLLVLLALSWFATNDSLETEVAGGEISASPPAAGTNEAGYPAPTSGSESAVPTPMGAPVIDAPAEAVPSGSVTLSGSAEPGTQIIILVDGQPAAAAIAGVDGAWSATIDLAAGVYSVQAQSVDNVGAIVGQSEPVEVAVADDPASGATAALGSPDFDPVSNSYLFSGTAAPGDTITLTSNGTVVGTTIADESGNWAISVPAESITGDVQQQTTDAAGNVTFQSEPVQLGPQPPSLIPPGEVLADPAGGAATVPVQSGSSTLTGQGEPGTRVEALIDGQSAGVADVGADGIWSLPVDLPAGPHTVQLNALDPSGDLLSGAPPFTVNAVDLASGTALPVATPLPATDAEATGAAATAAATTDAAATAPVATAPVTTTTPVATAPVVTIPIATGAPGQTIGDVLADNPEFSSLLAAVEIAGLGETLDGLRTHTVFAPVNAAFAALPQQVVDALLANPQVLAEILQYHLAFGSYLTSDLGVVAPSTVNGGLLTITPQNDTLLVNDATIIGADVTAENGVIHAIDRVLVPPPTEGVQPPSIDESGVSVFTGTDLTVVGTAEPNLRILVELNGEPLGQTVTVSPEGAWSVDGPVTPGDYRIVAYMLNADDTLEAISRPVTLQVR